MDAAEPHHRHPAAPAAGRRHAGRGRGGRLRHPGLARDAARQRKPGGRRRVPAHQAQGGPGLGPGDAACGHLHLSGHDLPHRLQRRLHARRPAVVPRGRRPGTGVHRAAPAPRRHPRPRRAGQADRHADLPGRDHRRPAHRGAGDPHRRLPLHQHQAAARRRAAECAGDPRPGARCRHTGLDRRDAGELGRRRRLHRARHPRQRHLPRRPVPVVPLLYPGPGHAAAGIRRAAHLPSVRDRPAGSGPGDAGRVHAPARRRNGGGQSESARTAP